MPIYFIFVFNFNGISSKSKATQNKPSHLNIILHIQSCVLCDIWNGTKIGGLINIPFVSPSTPYFSLQFEPDLTPWPCLVTLPFGFACVDQGCLCRRDTRHSMCTTQRGNCQLNRSQELCEHVTSWILCLGVWSLCTATVCFHHLLSTH